MSTSVTTYEDAPRGPTVTPALAGLYWTVVEDCLVKFHSFSREDAVKRVRDYLNRLATHLASLPWNAVNSEEQHKYDDMIYHEEPWYVACNLAQTQIPIESYVAAYHEILRRNHLMQ